MEWLRIGLSTIITTAVSFGALGLFYRQQKHREAVSPNNSEREKRRAQRIVTGIGSAVVHLVQLAGGLAAGISMFALLIFIGTASSIPKIEDVGLFAGLFVGGWMVFAWSLRITDALDEEP